MHIETEEINHFASRIDFRLVRILTLGQHGCSIDLVTVWTCQQLGCF